MDIERTRVQCQDMFVLLSLSPNQCCLLLLTMQNEGAFFLSSGRLAHSRAGGEHLEIADAGRHLERMQRGGFRALSVSVSAAVLMC